jgi:dUTP pyrophosphatase
MSVLKFIRITENAVAPTRASEFAAGYDLCAAKDVIVKANSTAKIPTDLVIAMPSGTYGRIAPRSGMALHNFIGIGGGVIDEDYRGPVNVVLFNHGKGSYEVNIGDRIAQLICEKIEHPEEILEVAVLDERKQRVTTASVRARSESTDSVVVIATVLK